MAHTGVKIQSGGAMEGFVKVPYHDLIAGLTKKEPIIPAYSQMKMEISNLKEFALKRIVLPFIFFFSNTFNRRIIQHFYCNFIKGRCPEGPRPLIIHDKGAKLLYNPFFL